MGRGKQIGLPLLAAGVLMAVVVGCGGSSSASEPSAEFHDPNPKEKIATFGQEASDAEREAVSEVLEESLEARAAGDFKRQCATLSEKGLALVRIGNAFFAKKPCWQGLRAQALPLKKTQEGRENTMTGPIAAFRVDGNKGWALYHGTEGQDYAMPMEKEGGEWKVKRLTERSLPATPEE
jgi:hypothetical protein